MRLTTPGIPRTVWALGLVSLFMDMSSELVHAVLPIYLTTVLGVSVLGVGIIEGIAEATASVLKALSGYGADRWRRRKPLALLGYGLSALTKPWFPLADGAAGVVAARFIDRIGKGIRGAPRDALVADVTPPALRDAAYGLRQSLDTVGAFAGPLLAMFFLWLWAGDLRQVLWVATLPALVAVAVLAFGVQEPDDPVPTKAAGTAGHLATPHWTGVRALPLSYWRVVGLGALFALARLSEAFLVLRAQADALPLVAIPLVMIVMSVVYAASSYPAGLLAAQHGRRLPLGLSLAVLVVAELALGLWPGAGGLWLGVALWGLHMGLSQGGLTAAVSDHAPAALRATGFGLFHLATGAAQLAGGAAAGWWWSRHGSAAAFCSGAVWAVLAAVVLVSLPKDTAK